MIRRAKQRLVRALRWSERYTKTDMVYLAKGGFWLTAGRGVAALISLGTLAAFANWLPQDTFGEYQFVLSVSAIVGLLSLPGINKALVRSIAKGNDGSLVHGFRTKLRWSSLGVVAFLAIAGWYFVHGNAVLGTAFTVVAVIFPIKTASGLFLGYWEGKKRFDVKVITRSVADVGIAATLITTLYFTDSLWLVFLALSGATALFHGVLFLHARSTAENDRRDSEMVPFGKNLTVMGVIGRVAGSLDSIILWKLFGPVEVALYAFSLKPVEKARGFLPIQALALPKLSESGVDTEKRKRSVFRKFILLFGVTVPAAGGFALLAPFGYSLIFPQYLESVVYFQVLTLLIALMPFTILSTALVAEMKTKYLYITQSAVPVLKIALFLSLAPFFGIWGIVGALLVAEVFRGGLSVYFFWRM